MIHRQTGRSRITLISMSLALALTAPAVLAQAEDTAAADTPRQGQAAVAAKPGQECTLVHIEEDKLHGINADHILVCNDEAAAARPMLKDNPNWSVHMRPSYDLPTGTKITYTYDAPSGNCIKNWRSWSETIGGPSHGETRPMFAAVVGAFWESCAWERSYGSWNITAVTPSGESGTVNIRIMTGAPNLPSHYAEVQCHFSKGLGCSGGSDTQLTKFGGIPTPSLRLGPLDSVQPPRAMELTCTGTAHLSIGKPMNNHHPCTIEGYPRPKIDVRGLPEGITLTRWPTENDTWLVLNGTLNKPFYGPITVTSTLPSGWADSRTFWLDAK